MCDTEPLCFRHKIRTITFAGFKTRGEHGELFQRDFEKKNASELDAYEAAVKQGINPSGTQRKPVEEADRMSNALGFAWDAGNPTEMFKKAGVIEDHGPIEPPYKGIGSNAEPPTD